MEPAVGRFLSRDVWEGDPNQPMSYNGWLYTHANPLTHIDPSGQCTVEDADGACEDRIPPDIAQTLAIYGVMTSADQDVRWSEHDLRGISNGVRSVAFSMARVVASIWRWVSPSATFRSVFGPVNFHRSAHSTWTDTDRNGRMDSGEYYYCQYTPGDSAVPRGVMCFEEAENHVVPRLVGHELGHMFNAMVANRRDAGEIPPDTVEPYDMLLQDAIHGCGWDPDARVFNLVFVAGRVAGEFATSQAGYFPYTRDNPSNSSQSEDFANMFGNWASTGFPGDAAGTARQNWMDYHMLYWLGRILHLPLDPPVLPLDWD